MLGEEKKGKRQKKCGEGKRLYNPGAFFLKKNARSSLRVKVMGRGRMT